MRPRPVGPPSRSPEQRTPGRPASHICGDRRPCGEGLTPFVDIAENVEQTEIIRFQTSDRPGSVLAGLEIPGVVLAHLRIAAEWIDGLGTGEASADPLRLGRKPVAGAFQ